MTLCQQLTIIHLLFTGNLLVEILGVGSVEVAEGRGKQGDVLVPGLFLTNTEQCDDRETAGSDWILVTL